MSQSERLAWAFTRLVFSGEDRVRIDGHTFKLRSVARACRNLQQVERVRAKHGLALTDKLLIETLPNGKKRHHYKVNTRDMKQQQVPA